MTEAFELPPEFQDFELDDSAVFDPERNPLSNQNGLSDWQRFVVKNIFDTQPQNRRKYLQRLGYEMSKDGEGYRPLGAKPKTRFQEIEPDNTVLGFVPFYNVFSEKGRKELARDFGDIAFDVAVSGPAIGVGATIGGTEGAGAGAALGAPIGAGIGGALGLGAGAAPGAGVGATIGSVIGGTGGAVTGGIAGNLTAETVKQGIGLALLEDDFSLDQQELLYQSLVAGGFMGIARNAGQVFSKWKKMKAEDIRDSLKEVAVRKSNGTWNSDMAQEFAENPEAFTPEAVKGANKKLLDLGDEIFGTSVENPHTTRQFKGGIARDAITPLNKQADLEIERLALDPNANFSVPELAEIMRARLDTLSRKRFPDPDEEVPVLDFFRKQLAEIKDKARVPQGPLPENETRRVDASGEFFELNFQEGRDILKRWQNSVFNKSGPLKDNSTGFQVTRSLKELADEKAGALGSQLPTINAKRSEILNLQKNYQRVVKDGSIAAGYLGKDSIAKQRFLRQIDEMDRVLETNLGPRIKSTQFQAAAENLYRSPSAFGSGSVLSDMAKGAFNQGTKEAFKFGSAGAAVSGLIGGTDFGSIAGKSAALGFGKGALKGAKEAAAFGSPKTLVKKFSKIKNSISDLERARNPSLLQGVTSKPAQVAAQIGPTDPSGLPPQPESFNQPLPTQQTPGQKEEFQLPPEFEDFEL